jgi:hypothetical protein
MPYMSIARNCVAHAALIIFYFLVFSFHLPRLCVVVAGLYA